MKPKSLETSGNREAHDTQCKHSSSLDVFVKNEEEEEQELDDDALLSSQYSCHSITSEYDIDAEDDGNGGQTTLWEFIPLMICLLIFIAIIVFVIIDTEDATRMLESIIDHIRDNPLKAVFIIIGLYIFLIIFVLPINPLTLIIAYAYAAVF